VTEATSRESGPAPEGRTIRVVVVDDHPLLLAGTEAVLAALPRVEVVGTALTGTDALQVVLAQVPDVLLLDVRLPDISGVEVVRRLRALRPSLPIVILTGYNDPAHRRELLELRVHAHLSKTATPAEIHAAVQAAAEGRRLPSGANGGEPHRRHGLTDREIEVLQYVATGRQNAEIAALLNVSKKTVEFHVGHLLDKLGARTRTAAVAAGRELGVL
jgi:DNA-binding NarL/FixJ family response regulator